jgi:dephospho-CoA kinase
MVLAFSLKLAVMNKIIGITGAFASGKSLAADTLASKYNLPTFSFGKMIESMLISEGLVPTRQNLQKRGYETIEAVGYDGIAEMLLKTNDIDTHKPCVIEGIRHIAVSDYYRAKFQDQFLLIYIDSSKQSRFERIKGIEYKKIIINSSEQFDLIDGHEIEAQIDSSKANADLIVENNSSKEIFVSKVLDLKLS